ncbi:MAG TPA: adenosylmethionine decarboxylase [Syntrophales bacterium]|nr:adenosylmethionine decarboxylase [Syntrophales bacterium]HPQ43646.1 adenosylmethionine decarboxylase [Syntrophales bacterium]
MYHKIGAVLKPQGTQIIAEFFNCSRDILNDRGSIEQILRDGIDRCDLGLVSLDSHCYDPIGVTAIAIISESHVAIHTYPEARHASLDIYTCSRNPQASLDLMDYFKEELSPGSTRIAEISRGNPIEVNNKNWITDDTNQNGFDIRYHIVKDVFGKISKYQNIRIIDNEDFGRMLFLDNDLQIAEKDAYLYNESMVSPLIEAEIPLHNVAILGGGDGGVLHELLKHNPRKVTLIDIDEEVTTACRRYMKGICHDAFDDERVEVINDDVFSFLDTPRRFDAIIYDLTMHPEAFIDMDRDIFLDNLFTRISASLNPSGMITVQCCSDYDEETLKVAEGLLTKFFSDVRFTKTYIPSYCTPWVFASGISK